MSIPADFTIQNTVWSNPVPDAATGQTSVSCTINALDANGEAKVFTVTASYKKAEMENRGYKGNIDETIRNVINATIEVLPYLAGTTISYNPDEPRDTTITKHVNNEFTGKKLADIQGKNKKLFDDITIVSEAFHRYFKDVKAAPVHIDISKGKEEQGDPKAAPSSKKPDPSIGFEQVHDMTESGESSGGTEEDDLFDHL